jgi:hypothetical protein
MSTVDRIETATVENLAEAECNYQMPFIENGN